MIDEVHILQEDRGPTLEVLVSRIKARATCRIVAVSASVSVINLVHETLPRCMF
jgi:replicative superfamily II helicase